MIDYIYLGSAPSNETCCQVGDENYSELSTKECKRYIELIISHFKQNYKRDPKCVLKIKTESHEYGSYKEVVAKFDSNDEEAVNDAFWIEANAPESWDNEKN